MTHLKTKSPSSPAAPRVSGQAISQRLAREGCHVVIADVNENGVAETAAAIAAETGRARRWRQDGRHAGSRVQALFERAAREFGRVDIVVANAAILIAEPIADADAEKWRAVMNVNLFGYFLVTKHACRLMKPQRSGSIININSKSGKKGSAANSAYAASKFGGIGHTQSVALEMAPFNVRCNAVCPGNLLDSPALDPSGKRPVRPIPSRRQSPRRQNVEDVRQAYINQVPMKRGCSYEDVCNAVVFLASDQSSYITGIALSVTGGQEMN